MSLLETNVLSALMTARPEPAEEEHVADAAKAARLTEKRKN
jgi:hypothetical protein